MISTCLKLFSRSREFRLDLGMQKQNRKWVNLTCHPGSHTKAQLLCEEILSLTTSDHKTMVCSTENAIEIAMKRYSLRVVIFYLEYHMNVHTHKFNMPKIKSIVYKTEVDKGIYIPNKRGDPRKKNFKIKFLESFGKQKQIELFQKCALVHIIIK